MAYDCLYPFTTGGGERVYRGFAEDLAERGYEVDYLTSMQWESVDSDPSVSVPFAAIAVAPHLKLYRSDGVRSSVAALRYALGLWWYLVHNRRTYALIIVSALPVLNVFATRLALIASDTRVVFDYLEVWNRRKWIEYAGRITGTIAWTLQHLAIRLSSRASCNSAFTARGLAAEGLSAEPIVSPGLIDKREAPSVVLDPARPPYALYAGRHIEDKQVETLPAAVTAARSTIPDLRLVILGDGPQRPAVEAAIAAVGSPDWIELRGFVSDNELAEAMGNAACLAHPSRREGFGLVVVEANGYGTPVVVVDAPMNAAKELVEQGINGLVARSTAPLDLGGAIADVVSSGRRLRATSRAWYDEAVTTRTIERTVSLILAAVSLPERPASPTRKECTE